MDMEFDPPLRTTFLSVQSAGGGGRGKNQVMYNPWNFNFRSLIELELRGKNDSDAYDETKPMMYI